MKPTLLIVSQLTLTFVCYGCIDMGTHIPFSTKPVAGDHSNISDPKARWAAYNLSDYVIDQEMMCFCPYEGTCRVVVRNGAVVDVLRKSDGVSIISGMGQCFKSVEQLFSFAESMHPDSVASLQVEYDRRFGFPKFVYIDYDRNAVDEEMGYRTTTIEEIDKWY